MPHDIIIIVDRMGEILKNLSGAQPEQSQWDSLMTAIYAGEEAIQANGRNATKLHHKLHDVQDFLVAGEPYDMATVVALTSAINLLL